MSQTNPSPVVPGTAISNADLLALADQIRMLVMTQTNRDNRMMEQIEVQLALFERLQNRLDDIEGRLVAIPDLLAHSPRAEEASSPAAPHPEAPVDYSFSPALTSWAEQRDLMLKELVAEGKEVVGPTGSTAYVPEIVSPSKQVHEAALPFNATPEQADEIEALKGQLKSAIREMELESSVLRAKLSQERLRLEQMEAELLQREKMMQRSPVGKKTKRSTEGSMVSRLRGLLGRSPDAPEKTS